ILNSGKLKFSVFKLAKCIRQEKPDLLFSTINGNNLAMMLAKGSSLKNTPVVIREANNLTQSGKVSFLNKKITRYTYNYLSDKVIALSEGVKQDLVNNFKVKPKKLEVIYNPVETNKIEEYSKEEIIDFTKKDNEKLIISVGRLVEQKDFKTLIKAFALVSKEYSVRLIILGKGPKEDELRKLSHSLGVKNRVHFLGFKKNPYKYMDKADLFVLSYKWEGFGHVIVEAMATGVPVISSNCNSGPKEIIGNNKYGMLAPVGDEIKISKTIKKLINDKKMRDKYSSQGYKRANYFKAANITKQYEKVFDKLLRF